MTNSGSSGNQNALKMPYGPACARTMSVMFRLPAQISTPTRAMPIAISYETTCAAERIAPRKAYLEFDDQPARMMPYTPIDVIASRYKRPALMLASTPFSSNGITAHAANAGVSASNGASTNSSLLDFAGIRYSLSNSLNTSANVCSRPAGPTLFGPMRTCIQPSTLRSHHTYSATARITGTAIVRMQATSQISSPGVPMLSSGS